jgi:hypothetical protein
MKKGEMGRICSKHAQNEKFLLNFGQKTLSEHNFQGM